MQRTFPMPYRREMMQINNLLRRVQFIQLTGQQHGKRISFDQGDYRLKGFEAVYHGTFPGQEYTVYLNYTKCYDIGRPLYGHTFTLTYMRQQWEEITVQHDILCTRLTGPNTDLVLVPHLL